MIFDFLETEKKTSFETSFVCFETSTNHSPTLIFDFEFCNSLRWALKPTRTEQHRGLPQSGLQDRNTNAQACRHVAPAMPNKTRVRFFLSSPLDPLLQALHDLEPGSSPEEFNELCYCLTLPGVSSHPDYASWTPHAGRLDCFEGLRGYLGLIFPGQESPSQVCK